MLTLATISGNIVYIMCQSSDCGCDYRKESFFHREEKFKKNTYRHTVNNITNQKHELLTIQRVLKLYSFLLLEVLGIKLRQHLHERTYDYHHYLSHTHNRAEHTLGVL